jgi:Beta-propeller repeat
LNAFVTKFDPTGNLVYSTYLGGGEGKGIAVDAHGNAYVTGFTAVTDFPTKNAFQSVLGGNSDAFVTKLNADGNALVYSTYFGGSKCDDEPCNSFEWANAIAVGVRGNAYITGFTATIDFPTQNAFQKTLNGIVGTTRVDAFVAELCPAGNALVYSTYLGGSGVDQGNGIAVDAHGRAYITGSTASRDFPTQNAFQPTFSSFSSPVDAFVTKLDAGGATLVYSTYLGGSKCKFEEIEGGFCNGQTGNGIAVDAHGHAYVTGQTDLSDFPTKNAFQTELKGFQDAFVTKFAADGQALLYSTYLGGYSYSEALGIAVDARGDAYITGHTGDFPTKDAFQPTVIGGVDAFVAKLDRNGDALVYSSYLGGSGSYYERGSAIAVDNGGEAYVVGSTESPDFPTKNAFQPMLVGSPSAFITKISAH